MPPLVLVLAGHDPTGGAGLIADSETIAACGGWALTVPTALTVQNGVDVRQVMPVAADAMRAMVDALEAEPIAAIKVGLVADRATLLAVVEIIRRFPGVPVVADPVLKAGGGATLTSAELHALYVERLLPCVDILTPNRFELALLTAATPGADDTARAVTLISHGCQAVLVTGTDDPLPVRSETAAEAAFVVHTLHSPEATRQWQWQRLPGQYHGSGCTLASAIAARLAVGERLLTACEQAQAFAWQSLAKAYRPERGQYLPNRLPRVSRWPDESP